MSIEFDSADVRATLVNTKHFSLHPKPLERWLWKQGIPQAAERVFWLHWEEGMRAGDWCSEIPIKRVARECAIDPSTVTRAYQLLKSLGLLKREDPGRDPQNPFCQATAITEVRLPRAFLTELSSFPNRAPRRGTPDPKPTVALATSPPSSKKDAGPSAPNQPTPTREASRAMWARASEAERAQFYTASRDRLTAMSFDETTQLTPDERTVILAQLKQLAAARPDVQHRTPSPQPKAAYAGPRRLNVLAQARVRRQILSVVPSSDSTEILRQVIWAVEEGALRRFPTSLALNIAVKKIREGAWSKPNRMPPQWSVRPACPGARTEQCSAA